MSIDALPVIFFFYDSIFEFQFQNRPEATQNRISCPKQETLAVTKDLLNRHNYDLRNILIKTQKLFIGAVLSYLTTIYAKNILQKYQFATNFKRILKNWFSFLATGHAEKENART